MKNYCSQIFQDFNNNNIEIYNKYIKKLDSSYFFDPNGVHGVLHCKRVLILNLLILKQLKIDSFDNLNVLSLASVFHDIGRFHNGECNIHGFRSWRKMIKRGIVDELKNKSDEDAVNILKFIIENHCISDETSISSLYNYNINDKEKALMLYSIFKDADALDRVRLDDLDPSYLRNKVPVEIIEIATCLLEMGANI